MNWSSEVRSKTATSAGCRILRVTLRTIGFVLLAVSVSAGLLQAQNSAYVDPFLGVDGGGNTFPGPSLPFGVIKPGPDLGANDQNAGWAATGDINGFSQTHVSGTGGGPKYGNILLQPTTGVPNPASYGSARENEKGSIGYYRVTLLRYSIDVEITAARRTALYQFTYPASEQANILFDTSHCLTALAQYGEGQSVAASSITVLSPTEVSGFSSVVGGWNKQPTPYTVYFYAQTDTPAQKWGTWRDGVVSSERSQRGNAAHTGAFLSFPTRVDQQVRLKIGISFVSIDQARKNAGQDISGFDFDHTHQAAISAWDSALAPLEIKAATEQQRRTFYTALYHTMLMPVDRTGENPLWNSAEPYYDDFYAIWDTFRTSGPLLTLIAPAREQQIVRALIETYRQENWLPDARSGNYTGRTQGGSNAEFMLADAFVKHLSGIDWGTAYAAMRQDAEAISPQPEREGRGGLEDWKSLGYVTIEGTDRPGSKQMEYAADDFEIALLARGLGHPDDYDRYHRRSQNWKNLWNDSLEDGGFKGFIWPRHRDGSWKARFDGLASCSWGGDTFYEGNSWTYSLFVPQDVTGLIQKSGGPVRFVERLDAFFDVPERYDVGNEPGFLAPYLYTWAGRQDKTAQRVRQIIAKNFHAGPSGLPGNDDSGAMSSWYAFGVIGIFPNAGQDVYLIGSPQFGEVTFHLPGNKSFVIEAKNTSDRNIYVTAAELNGRPLPRAWLRHDEIVRGGRLVLTMAASPSRSWPTGPPPPSDSD